MVRSKKEKEIKELLDNEDTFNLGKRLLLEYLEKYVLENQKYITHCYLDGWVSKHDAFKIHGPCFTLGFQFEHYNQHVESMKEYYVIKKHSCFLKLKSLFKYLATNNKSFHYSYMNIYRTKSYVVNEKILSLNHFVNHLASWNISETDTIRNCILDVSDGRLITSGGVNYLSIYGVNTGLNNQCYYTVKTIDESLYY